MSTRSIKLAALAVAVFACGGCRISSFSMSAYDDDHYHHRPARVTHVYAQHGGHVCTHDCRDHYWNGTRLVVLASGHRHGPHCGHHWNGSHWIVVGGHKVKPLLRGRGKGKMKRRGF